MILAAALLLPSSALAADCVSAALAVEEAASRGEATEVLEQARLAACVEGSVATQPRFEVPDWTPSLFDGSIPLGTKEVDASGSQLSYIDAPLGVEILDLSDTPMERMPDLPLTLRVLDLSGTKVRHSVGYNERLEVLDLSDTPITFVQDLPIQLKILVARGMKLDGISELPPALVALDLSGTKVGALPRIPGTLRYLALKDAQHDWLHDLPADLDYLDLRGVKAKGAWPDTIRCVVSETREGPAVVASPSACGLDPEILRWLPP